MELSQLRSFRLVAEQRSFSKAATILHLTQPAVTQQIKNLEIELGEILFERSGRQPSLTQAGEALLTYAQQILNLAGTATETIRQFSRIRGRLTIGAGTTNTSFRLPQILQTYRRSYPQVEIRIRNGDSELISRLVWENSVDLGLITTINPDLHLQSIPLFEDRIFLVAPTGHPQSLSPAELAGESLILFRSGSGFRRFLEDHFQASRFTPQVIMELESMEAIIRMVASGLGLAFLPEVAVHGELERGELVRVRIEGWPKLARQTFLIYRRDNHLSWPVEALLSQLNGES